MKRWSLFLAVVAAFAALAEPATATVPANFSDTLVAGIVAPTAIAFTPDGRMLVSSQGGVLRVVSGGGTTVALNLSASTCSDVERGLLGIAVDPSFASNHFIFLYQTVNKAGTCVNRVSRFVLPDTNVIDPASQAVLLDDIPSPAGNHNGGDLNFGPEGLLYVSVGDGGCDYAGNSGCGGENDASRDRNVLLGKILRITRDGTVPLRNPFNHRGNWRCGITGTGASPPGTICRETYAWGFRNPFRFAFDPNTPSTRFFINDVGQNTWEEIDVGQNGADYGWNVREGFCANGSTTDCGPPPAGMTNPIFAYRSGAITGGAFVPNGIWPGYDGSYLYADFNNGTISRLDANGTGGFTSSAFASGLGNVVHLEFGPFGQTQALYYSTYTNGGQVRRIAFQPAGMIPGVTTGPFAGF